jgi:hypothetical protein
MGRGRRVRIGLFPGKNRVKTGFEHRVVETNSIQIPAASTDHVNNEELPYEKGDLMS